METLTMAKSAIQKIAMNPSENIAYDKLVLSQENVRRVKDGVTIEQLADDIGRLIQSQRPINADDLADPMKDPDPEQLQTGRSSRCHVKLPLTALRKSPG